MLTIATSYTYVHLIKRKTECTGIAMCLAIICDCIWLTTLAAQ